MNTKCLDNAKLYKLHTFKKKSNQYPLMKKYIPLEFEENKNFVKCIRENNRVRV